MMVPSSPAHPTEEKINVERASLRPENGAPGRFAVRRLDFVFAAVLMLLTLTMGMRLPLLWGVVPGRVGAPVVTSPVVDRTAAGQPLVRLAVLGDVGTGGAAEWATAGLVADIGTSDPFDGLILLGDNVYPNGDPDRLGATVFDPFEPVLSSGARLLPVLGNHDVRDGNGPGQVARLGMPGRWYAADVGGVLFVGLDSTQPEDARQLLWLEETLAASDAEWTVVAMHHPPFSAGFHGSNEDVREAFASMFERYGVDLVFAGHDHDYQRSVPIGGVTYVVTGAAAKTRPTDRASFTAASASIRHFVELGVWSDRLEVKAISQEGVFDTVVIPIAPNDDVTSAVASGSVGFATWTVLAW